MIFLRRVLFPTCILLTAILGVSSVYAEGAEGACPPPDLKSIVSQCRDDRGLLTDFANIEKPSRVQRISAKLEPGPPGSLEVPIRIKVKEKSMTVVLAWYSRDPLLCKDISSARVEKKFEPEPPEQRNTWLSKQLTLKIGMSSLPKVKRRSVSGKGCLVLNIEGEEYQGKYRTKPEELDIFPKQIPFQEIPDKKRKPITSKRRTTSIGYLKDSNSIDWLKRTGSLTVTSVNRTLEGYGPRDFVLSAKQYDAGVILRANVSRRVRSEKEARATLLLSIEDHSGWILLSRPLPVEIWIKGPFSWVPYIVFSILIVATVLISFLLKYSYPPVSHRLCLRNLKTEEIRELFINHSSRFKKPLDSVPLERWGFKEGGSLDLSMTRDGAIVAKLPEGVTLFTEKEERKGTWTVSQVDKKGRLKFSVVLQTNDAELKLQNIGGSR